MLTENQYKLIINILEKEKIIQKDLIKKAKEEQIPASNEDFITVIRMQAELMLCIDSVKDEQRMHQKLLL